MTSRSLGKAVPPCAAHTVALNEPGSLRTASHPGWTVAYHDKDCDLRSRKGWVKKKKKSTIHSSALITTVAHMFLGRDFSFHSFFFFLFLVVSPMLWSPAVRCCCCRLAAGNTLTCVCVCVCGGGGLSAFYSSSNLPPPSLLVKNTRGFGRGDEVLLRQPYSRPLSQGPGS